jgi:hypothetical protein
MFSWLPLLLSQPGLMLQLPRLLVTNLFPGEQLLQNVGQQI